MLFVNKYFYILRYTTYTYVFPRMFIEYLLIECWYEKITMCLIIYLQGEKMLIFTQYKLVLNILEEYLRIRGHSYLRLDGSTPVPERYVCMNISGRVIK